MPTISGKNIRQSHMRLIKQFGKVYMQLLVDAVVIKKKKAVISSSYKALAEVATVLLMINFYHQFPFLLVVGAK